VELQRDNIERTDFSRSRRGYDPREVDAHLQQVTEAVESLRGRVDKLSARPESLSEAANERLQRILEAAEASAAEVRTEAGEEARGLIEDAQREARTMIEEAEGRAGDRDSESEATSAERLKRVEDRTGDLMRRADELDGEFDRLLEHMRAAAAGAVETLRQGVTSLRDELDELPGESPSDRSSEAADTDGAIETSDVDGVGVSSERDEPETVVEPRGDTEPLGDEVIPEPREGEELPEPPRDPHDDASAEDGRPELAPASGSGEADAEGARLIALNMALSGSSRAETAEYLRETFGVEDRALLDDVFDRVQAS
jgi:DivIVA domain-containing protein